MHIKEAIRILTTELARRSGISIVRDDLYKKELIEKSSYFHQFSNPIVIDYSYHNTMSHINKNDSKSIIQGWYFSNNKNDIETNVVYSDLGKLIEDIEFCKGANYFFVDNPLQEKSAETPKSLKGFHIFVTPYSIIGKDEITDIKEIFYKYAGDAQLDYVSPVWRLVLEQFDARLYIGAAHNTRELSGVNPERQQRANRAGADLRKTFMERMATRDMHKTARRFLSVTRWCRWSVRYRWT